MTRPASSLEASGRPEAGGEQRGARAPEACKQRPEARTSEEGPVTLTPQPHLGPAQSSGAWGTHPMVVLGPGTLLLTEWKRFWANSSRCVCVCAGGRCPPPKNLSYLALVLGIGVVLGSVSASFLGAKALENSTFKICEMQLLQLVKGNVRHGNAHMRRQGGSKAGHLNFCCGKWSKMNNLGLVQAGRSTS